MFLYRPARYVGVSRGRFRRFDLKTDARNLCHRKISPSAKFVSRRKHNVRVSQPPDLALCESRHAKHRSLVVARSRMKRSVLHPTRRSNVMPALSKVAARHFAGCRIRNRAVRRGAQDNAKYPSVKPHEHVLCHGTWYGRRGQHTLMCRPCRH